MFADPDVERGASGALIRSAVLLAARDLILLAVAKYIAFEPVIAEEAKLLGLIAGGAVGRALER